MKRTKIIAMASALVLGIGGAFATRPTVTYFAVEDAPGSNSYHWETTNPESRGYACVAGPARCSANWTSTPISNQLPAGQPSQNLIYRMQ
ncbi:hypothetical protein [Chitinophaga rhizophila]|uniref:Secreted protein n=1 Tax=Chitinophaga rhizophila TaxID=2866212 RepID=A0ABS7G863_9BACT|nr:hypothetical protein [Chitinophaga rhizophila]MBW8683490.1 hypothetical protein [Chitinophaga rhizophila]